MVDDYLGCIFLIFSMRVHTDIKKLIIIESEL